MNYKDLTKEEQNRMEFVHRELVPLAIDWFDDMSDGLQKEYLNAAKNIGEPVLNSMNNLYDFSRQVFGEKPKKMTFTDFIEEYKKGAEGIDNDNIEPLFERVMVYDVGNVFKSMLIKYSDAEPQDRKELREYYQDVKKAFSEYSAVKGKVIDQIFRGVPASVTKNIQGWRLEFFKEVDKELDTLHRGYYPNLGNVLTEARGNEQSNRKSGLIPPPDISLN